MENQTHKSIHKIPPFSEWRIHFSSFSAFNIKCLTGRCEVFGADLVQHKANHFKNQLGLPVFSWEGCSVELEYFLPEKNGSLAPEIFTLNHSIVPDILQSVKTVIKEKSALRRSLMVLGGENSGKTSVTTSLCNYSVRLGVSVMMVDLDVNSNFFAIPGTISAAIISSVIPQAPSSNKISPIVAFFGHEAINRSNFKKYAKCVDFLFDSLLSVLSPLKPEESPLILIKFKSFNNTVLDLKIIEHIETKIKIFNILAIGLDSVVSRLKSKNAETKIFQISSLLNAIPPTNANLRNEKRNLQFKKYFFGHSNELLPHKIFLKSANFTLYILSERILPLTALPKGESVEQAIESKPKAISVTPQATGKVLGICGSKVDDRIFMFLGRRVSLTEDKSAIQILCPSENGVPSRKLFCSDMKWFEN